MVLNVIKPELMSFGKTFHLMKLPAPARTLAQRILLEARRRTLTEWLNLVKTTAVYTATSKELVRGHRMAHQNPNTANIPTEVKLYGHEMRALWGVTMTISRWRGCGRHPTPYLRTLHQRPRVHKRTRCWKRKTKVTRTLNQRILGAVCSSRQIAKRFIYALLLGAGIGKLAEILSCSKRQAEEALERVLQRYTGFAELKSTRIHKTLEEAGLSGLTDAQLEYRAVTWVDEDTYVCLDIYKRVKR